MNLSFLGLLSCHFIKELDDFSRFFLNIKAKRLASDAKIQSLRGDKERKSDKNDFDHDF